MNFMRPDLVATCCSHSITSDLAHPDVAGRSWQEQAAAVLDDMFEQSSRAKQSPNR